MSKAGIGSYPYHNWYILGTYSGLGFYIIIDTCRYGFILCYVGGSLRITLSGKCKYNGLVNLLCAGE